ncbi:MAG TPA: hypothetical protein VET30_01715, partial [Pseudoxanthomonas sp.]|nr:hypothetical protein [Pseudoxanthomonas sp.]
GYDELARRLGVATPDIISWSAGRSTPSTATFLLVLDAILVETRNVCSAAMAYGLVELALAKAASAEPTKKLDR